MLMKLYVVNAGMDNKNLINNLCIFGLHKWKYWRMSILFIKAFPEKISINRTCKRCKIIQCTEDGLNWRQRL
jgi:hypothetical protein